MSFTLICLVEGESIERAFPVNIEPSDLVGTLKKRIKDEKAIDFQHIDADKLTLFLDDEIENTYDSKPILSDAAVRLSPIARVNKYFSIQPKPEQIHIVVRPPAITFTTIEETTQLFKCQAYLKKERRSFFFDYKKDQQPTEHWQQFQSLIKQAFDKYLLEVDSAVINIQTKNGEVDVTSGVELAYFMRENADTRELVFAVIIRNYYFFYF